MPCFKFLLRTACAVIFTVLLIMTKSVNLLAAAPSSNEFPVNLLFAKKDIPRILQNTRLPMFQEYWQSLLDADVRRDGNFMREAFLYAVTGDVKRGDLAREEMLKTLKLKRWDVFLEDGKHTLGFLKAGRLTAWMALGYDWIYDLLSPAERKEILRQIAEQGCVPLYRALHGMRYPETVKGWGFDPEQPYKFDVPDMSHWPVILGHNNFRAVISGGLTLGIYTLAGKDDRTEKWREMVMDSYYRSAKLFERDGSYDEGVSYCNYAMTYLMYLMEGVERKEGIDLFDAANYVGMMDYNLALFLPHHLNPAGSVNFGDAATSLTSAKGFWVARKSRDGLAQYIALNYAPDHDIFSLVYYDPTVRAVPPSPDAHFKKLDLDWIVTRNGYGMDDLVVAMRSGDPANHEHADRNSVILKYGGEVLLADQYRPTYDASKPDWLLRTSLAHNTVVIDGQGQQYHKGEEGTNAGRASAKIVRWGSRTGYDFWVSDATKAYSIVNRDVKSVTRTTLVFPSIAGLIVIDKLIKTETPSSFSARWFAENRDNMAACSVDGSSFVITRPSAKFLAATNGSSKTIVRAEKLPLPDSLGLFKYVDVRTSDDGKDPLLIMAGVALSADESAPNIAIARAENLWHIKIVRDDRKLEVKVYDQDTIPEFEILENDFK